MPGAWIQTQDSWMMIPLDGAKSSRTLECASRERLRARQTRSGAFLMLSPATGAPVLVAGPDSGARVNGNPLPLGIRALRDRDEIFLTRCGARLYYTDECLASVVQFAGADRPVFCPRCKTEIAHDSPAVQCPRCRLWHHQSAELPCWTYAETCTACDQRTALDGGYSWTPEGL